LDAVYIILELETEPKRKISQVLIIILINTIETGKRKVMSVFVLWQLTHSLFTNHFLLSIYTSKTNKAEPLLVDSALLIDGISSKFPKASLRKNILHQIP
jgi:hypothetical protein